LALPPAPHQAERQHLQLPRRETRAWHYPQPKAPIITGSPEPHSQIFHAQAGFNEQIFGTEEQISASLVMGPVSDPFAFGQMGPAFAASDLIVVSVAEVEGHELIAID
jgi:hypothetical protein